MTRTVALAACLLLSASTSHAQSSDTPSSQTPGLWEITAELNYPGYWKASASGGEMTTERGFSARVGYRPTSTRRTLVEVYGVYVPPGTGAYSQAPQLSTVGVRATYLARQTDQWINPYVGGGIGFWRVEARPLPPCRTSSRTARNSRRSRRAATGAFDRRQCVAVEDCLKDPDLLMLANTR